MSRRSFGLPMTEPRRIAIRTKAPPIDEEKDRGAAHSPLLIADELEKLDALRERGILTQDEFERQKAKLLAH